MLIVRRETFLSWLSYYPVDLYLRINEGLSLINWDAYGKRYLIPLGLLMNLLLLITRSYQLHNNTIVLRGKNRIHSDLFDTSKTLPISDFLYDSSTKRSSGFTAFLEYLFSTINTILVTISFFNAYILFFRSSRTYSLLIRGNDYIPNTPSAFKEEINPEFFTDQSESMSLATKVLRYVFPSSFKGSNQDPVGRFVWRLDVWEPSHLQLLIFAIFSPIHIVYYYSLDSVSYATLLYLIALSSFLYYLIFTKFLVLIEDRQLILSETLNEYDQKFVKPRLSKRYVDASIDATQGPFYAQSSAQFVPNVRSREFHTFKFKEQHNLANKDQALLRQNIKRRESGGAPLGRHSSTFRQIYDDHKGDATFSRKSNFY